MGAMPKKVWLEARIHCLQNGVIRWAVVQHTTAQLLKRVLLLRTYPHGPNLTLNVILAKAEAEYGKAI